MKQAEGKPSGTAASAVATDRSSAATPAAAPPLEHALQAIAGGSTEKVTAALICPICLDLAQLPVNMTCFAGCSGTQNRGNTCMRSVMCQMCANQIFQFDKPPSFRLPKTKGMVSCLICRDTKANARKLTPASAYHLNQNVMEVMDLLGFESRCRACDLAFGSQSELQVHYQRTCPAAIVQCSYAGCDFYSLPLDMKAHLEVCPVGRRKCIQCSLYLDKDELLLHLVTSCKYRMVSCVVCKMQARLPDMLDHLQSHQIQLQQQKLPGAPAPAPAAATPAAAAASTAAAGFPQWVSTGNHKSSTTISATSHAELRRTSAIRQASHPDLAMVTSSTPSAARVSTFSSGSASLVPAFSAASPLRAAASTPAMGVPSVSVCRAQAHSKVHHSLNPVQGRNLAANTAATQSSRLLQLSSNPNSNSNSALHRHLGGSTQSQAQSPATAGRAGTRVQPPPHSSAHPAHLATSTSAITPQLQPYLQPLCYSAPYSPAKTALTTPASSSKNVPGVSNSRTPTMFSNVMPQNGLVHRAQTSHTTRIGSSSSRLQAQLLMAGNAAVPTASNCVSSRSTSSSQAQHLVAPNSTMHACSSRGGSGGMGGVGGSCSNTGGSSQIQQSVTPNISMYACSSHGGGCGGVSCCNTGSNISSINGINNRSINGVATQSIRTAANHAQLDSNWAGNATRAAPAMRATPSAQGPLTPASASSACHSPDTGDLDNYGESVISSCSDTCGSLSSVSNAPATSDSAKSSHDSGAAKSDLIRSSHDSAMSSPIHRGTQLQAPVAIAANAECAHPATSTPCAWDLQTANAASGHPVASASAGGARELQAPISVNAHHQASLSNCASVHLPTSEPDASPQAARAALHTPHQAIMFSSPSLRRASALAMSLKPAGSHGPSPRTNISRELPLNTGHSSPAATATILGYDTSNAADPTISGCDSPYGPIMLSGVSACMSSTLSPDHVSSIEAVHSADEAVPSAAAVVAMAGTALTAPHTSAPNTAHLPSNNRQTALNGPPPNIIPQVSSSMPGSDSPLTTVSGSPNGDDPLNTTSGSSAISLSVLLAHPGSEGAAVALPHAQLPALPPVNCYSADSMPSQVLLLSPSNFPFHRSINYHSEGNISLGWIALDRGSRGSAEGSASSRGVNSCPLSGHATGTRAGGINWSDPGGGASDGLTAATEGTGTMLASAGGAPGADSLAEAGPRADCGILPNLDSLITTMHQDLSRALRASPGADGAALASSVAWGGSDVHCLDMVDAQGNSPRQFGGGPVLRRSISVDTGALLDLIREASAIADELMCVSNELMLGRC